MPKLANVSGIAEYGPYMYVLNMRPVTYHLTDQQLTKLRALSRKTGLKVAEIIRRAIDAFLKEAE